MTQEEVRLKREAAQILLTFFRCVVMKRALQNNDNWSLNFFSLYDSCLMDVAVISWWKIFGENKEALNWKRLVSAQRKNEFLRKNVGFISLHKDAKKYRDKYLAHHEFDKSKRPSHHIELQPLFDAGLWLYAILYADLKNAGRTNGLPKPTSFQQIEEIEAHSAMIVATASAAVENFQDNP